MTKPDDIGAITAARAVWDFTTGDERRFRDRLELAIDAAEEFRQRGVAFDFVVLLHGAATQFAVRSLAGTKFGAAGSSTELTAAHEVMRRFCAVGGRIRVCRIAMERSNIAGGNLIADID